MPDLVATAPDRIDYGLIAQLLTEALAVLDSDRSEARRRIARAKSLAQDPCAAAPMAGGRMAGWQLRRLTDFVDDHISDRLTIEQVASVVRMSPGYLSRSFKATTGTTYSEFVLAARIELAKRLLLTTDTQISEIALACGLTDQSHLTRLFKRRVGLPPGAWRRLGSVDGETRRSPPRSADRHRHDEADLADRIELGSR